MSQFNTGSAMILSPINASAEQVTALSHPRTVSDVLGAATTQDFEAVMRQQLRDNFIRVRNEVSGRLTAVEKKITEARKTYDAIGPSLAGKVDTSIATEIAELINKNGFGKAAVEVKFEGRDEEKKLFNYEVAVVDPKDASSYSREYVNKKVTQPFTAEAKKLHKDIIEMLKAKQSIENELLKVKRDMANLDEHVQAARAEMGRERIKKLAGGEEFLNKLTKTKPVVASHVTAEAA
jgi:hypothetical protein